MKSFFKKIIITILTLEARVVLWRYKPKIIAITGNVGKTTTKDAVFAVLSGSFSARKSEKSFNSELGIPLAILGLPNGWNNPFVWLGNIFRGFFLIFAIPYTLYPIPFPLFLVLEIGADKPGDIEKICQWLSPDAVIVTRFGEAPVHLEFFRSREELMKEKAFLVKALKDNGLLILNADDKDVLSLRDEKRLCRLVTVGLGDADFQASNFEINYEEVKNKTRPTGISFKTNYEGNCVPVKLSGTVGRHHVYPILCALAVGKELGINMVKMIQMVAMHQSPPGRMRILEGVKGATLIDDSYNASPLATAEALATLAEIETHGRKIAVLGDMLELGKYSVREHERIGKKAREVLESEGVLFTVGILARDIAKGALENGMDEKRIFQFDNSTEAGKQVEMAMGDGDIVLIKGSQGARMERIVEEVMARPEEKKKLLVRQEREWQGKV